MRLQNIFTPPNAAINSLIQIERKMLSSRVPSKSECLWYVEIYVRDCIPKSFLARATMKEEKNIVDVARCISSMMVHFVLAVVWH